MKMPMKNDGFRLPITYAIVTCKCGEVFHFHHNFPAICHRCGNKVYPSQKWKFKDEIKKCLKKRRRYE